MTRSRTSSTWNPNKKIDPQKVIGGLRDLKVKWSRGSGDPAYIRAIDDVERNFLDQHVDPYNPQLTGPQAQNIKKGLYDEVRRESPQAWSGNPVPIPTQAKQELANALRQELEYAYPTIGKLNQNEGSLIELEKSLDRFISREGNRKILPYLAPLIAVGGGMAGGHPEAGLGTAAAIMGTHFVRTALEDPEVKSRLGIALSQATNSALGRGVAAVAPYAPSLGLRFAGQAAANTQMPPQDVIDSLGPGDHVFRNGISIRKNPDGSVIRLK